MLIHWDLGTHLLFKSQSHGVGLHFLMLDTALQVGVIVPLTPPQPVAIFVKPKARKEDEVKSTCGNRNVLGGSTVTSRLLQDSLFFLLTSIVSFIF